MLKSLLNSKNLALILSRSVKRLPRLKSIVIYLRVKETKTYGWQYYGVIGICSAVDGRWIFYYVKHIIYLSVYMRL